MGRGGERPLNEGLHVNVFLNGAARWIVAACVAFLSCTAPVYARQAGASSTSTAPQSQAAQQNPNAANASSAASAIASYPDSPAGLEKLIKDMMKMQKDGDAKDLAPHVQSLILPNPDAWFRATFGDEIGKELADSYQRTSLELPLSFPDTLSQMQAKHMTRPKAVRFTDSCNMDATDTEYPLLLRRTNAQPLYDIRFPTGIQLTVMRYFAYVDGAFRYLGSFQIRAPDVHARKLSGATGSPKPLSVGGSVMPAKIIKQVTPIYPAEAKSHYIQGTVLLHALIDKDGNIDDLQLMQGSCLLAQAAMEAVHQWRYSPTIVEGTPVAVDTTITVVFDLQR
jgi:TonB family protein